MGLGVLFGCAHVAVGQHGAYGLYGWTAIGMFTGTWLTRPKCVVIEGNTLMMGITEHHGADMTITNRQGLDPLTGRLTIP
jgi:hypothetical protein